MSADITLWSKERQNSSKDKLDWAKENENSKDIGVRANALYILSICHRYGWCDESVDFKKADEYLELSAQLGHAQACVDFFRNNNNYKFNREYVNNALESVDDRQFDCDIIDYNQKSMESALKEIKEVFEKETPMVMATQKDMGIDKSVFSSSSQKSTPFSFTPLFHTKPAVSATAFRKRLLSGLKKSEYLQLKSELISFGLEKKHENLFFQVGHPILSWAVAQAPNAEALNFLYQEIPIKTMKLVLGFENFDILKKFLMVQSGLEKLGLQQDEEEQLLNVEKFKLLLKIDFDGVQEFTKTDVAKPYMTKNVMKNFSEALEKCKSEQPFLP